MTDFFMEQQWLLIGLAFFGIIFYISWIRWQDRKWIERRFGHQKILAMSFGVNYFGSAAEPGPPRRSSGFLLLLSDRLYYRSRWKKLELEIPGSRLVRVYPDRAHKGVDLHQSVIKVDFSNARNQNDTAAFKVPYPPQWIRAIENTFLKR
jgi:hypothetical protein